MQTRLVKREDIFLISKVWVDDFDDVEAACRRNLDKLGLEYIDLYLVHWPLSATGFRKEKPTDANIYERTKIPMHKVWP